MHLLKHCVPFIWNDQAQHYFDSLKHALNKTPLFNPLITLNITSFTSLHIPPQKDAVQG